MKEMINHPTKALLSVCEWVNKRVSENVLIGMFCVGALIAAFAV